MKVSSPPSRSRNETIIGDRSKSLESSVNVKGSQLTGISKLIKKLNKDNQRKEEELKRLKGEMQDMKEKHSVTLDLVGEERQGIEDGMSHEVFVLGEEVRQKQRMAEHMQELESQVRCVAV